MSRNKHPIGTKGETTPLTNEAMERCGELPTVEHMYGYMVAHAMDLEQKLAESRLAGPGDGEKPVAWLNEAGGAVITDAKLKEMAAGPFAWAVEKHWKNPTPLYARSRATALPVTKEK